MSATDGERGPLERRLAALEDEREIGRLLNTYGHTIDYGPEAEFVECWTEDAELTYGYEAVRAGRGSGPDDMRFEGRAQIAAFWRDHTHAPERFHKHLMVEPRIELDDDRARVDSYFVRLDEAEAGPVLICFGRYRDLVVRCADRRWRFAARHGEIESLVARRPHGPTTTGG